MATAVPQGGIPSNGHTDLAYSLNNLASLLQAQGKYAEAESLFRDTLKMYQRLFKDAHPSVATSLNNLAGLLNDQGKYAEAEPLFRESLKMFQRLFKGVHPDLAASLNNLAGPLQAGQYAEAESLYHDASR